MKDGDVDIRLRQHLSGDQPREGFKQETLRDSTAEFVRIQRQRSAWRRAELAAAAVLIAGIAFLGGRLSAPPTSPRSVDVAPQAVAESDSVAVPSDLVAWLDAARLFGQLGMQDRMARAVERAGKLLPSEVGTASTAAEQTYAADGIVENQKEAIESMAGQGSDPSAESSNRILAQVFGD
ncbi:MAG: hypothetical protein P8Z79_02745 [Sedimentisphaerales bacterium]|jgi:hypothetical protein